MKQTYNESDICDLTLEQNTFAMEYLIKTKFLWAIELYIMYLRQMFEMFRRMLVIIVDYNQSFCQRRYNHILNVDAPVFYMNLSGHNELSLEYNVYAKVFIPAGSDSVCNKNTLIMLGM